MNSDFEKFSENPNSDFEKISEKFSEFMFPEFNQNLNSDAEWKLDMA